MRALLVSVCALCLVACFGSPEILSACDPVDEVTPICGFTNPEDLAPLPGGAWIAVSEYGGPAANAGRLLAFRMADGRKLELFPAGQTADEISATRRDDWGSPDCPGPPDPALFSPHGIDVHAPSHRLAAVNHGGRESIELFELGHAVRGPALVWRGCVPLPEGVLPNDVALLPGGGLVATKMIAAGSGGSQLLSLLRLVLGRATGLLLEWRAESGWHPVADSEGVGPNGLAVSADGNTLYVAEWGGSRLIRLRRSADGTVRRDTVDLPHMPDNVTWTDDRHLLVTGQHGGIGAVMGCGQVEEGTCALRFSVVRVEPTTLDVELILDHDAKAHGAGTVALQVDDEIYIGTFAGDRLARIPYEP